jgi:hypothetical protein
MPENKTKNPSNKQKTSRFILFSIPLTIIIAILIGGYWLFAEYRKYNGNNDQSNFFYLYSQSEFFIEGLICYPEIVITRNKHLMELTLTNQLNSEIKNIKVSFIFPEESAVSIISNDGSSLVSFEKLSANEKKTKNIKFSLKKVENLEIKFSLRVVINGKIIEKNYEMRVKEPSLNYSKVVPYIFSLIVAFWSIVFTTYLSERAKEIFPGKPENEQNI